MTRYRFCHLAGFVLLFLLAVSACSGPSNVSSNGDVDGSGELLQAETPEQAIDIVVSVLNKQRRLSRSTYNSLFTEQFRDRLSLRDFEDATAELAARGPWVLGDSLADPYGTAKYLLTNGAAEPHVATVVVADGSVSDLRITPKTPSPENVADALVRLNGAGNFAYVTAEATTNGDCRLIDGQDPDRIVPWASVSKLFILSALIDAVDAGQVNWDDPIVIRDMFDSYPTGVTQNVPAGETRTVRELADLMISISDNTASDHLLSLLGRTTVEDAQQLWGISDANLNRPFLSTRELILLKLDPDLGERFAAADVAEQKSLLVALSEQQLPPRETVTWTDPKAITSIEWFASPADICRVLSRLARNDDANQILQQQPGGTSDRWSAIGFKAGNEPGLFAVAWVLVDDDDRRWVFAGSVWNQQQTFEQDAVFDAFLLLREELDLLSVYPTD